MEQSGERTPAQADLGTPAVLTGNPNADELQVRLPIGPAENLAVQQLACMNAPLVPLRPLVQEVTRPLRPVTKAQWLSRAVAKPRDPLVAQQRTRVAQWRRARGLCHHPIITTVSQSSAQLFCFRASDSMSEWQVWLASASAAALA